jgi:DNA-binding CsgD family transcriptional regulator
MLEDIDIYELVDLLGKASALDSPMASKKQFLLDGFCALIGAEAWSWTLKPRSGSRGAPIESASGGSRALLARRAKARAGKRTLTFCELSDGAASSIVFLRRASRPPFTEREKWLVQIVCEEIPWLHESPRALPAPEPAPEAQLSPRQRETLHLLLAGFSRQEVSRRMGISPHTVHDYVKNLYRHFGQHSRASLVTRLTDTNRPE